MKTYEQLSTEEKDKARRIALEGWLTAIVEGAVRFDDKLNGDDLQARIDAACDKAGDMQTPWFAHEYIMETCADDLTALAEADVQDALYPDPDERIIRP